LRGIARNLKFLPRSDFFAVQTFFACKIGLRQFVLPLGDLDVGPELGDVTAFNHGKHVATSDRVAKVAPDLDHPAPYGARDDRCMLRIRRDDCRRLDGPGERLPDRHDLDSCRFDLLVRQRDKVFLGFGLAAFFLRSFAPLSGLAPGFAFLGLFGLFGLFAFGIRALSAMFGSFLTAGRFRLGRACAQEDHRGTQARSEYRLHGSVLINWRVGTL